MRFDTIILNPPYGKFHIKFLEKVIQLADNVISIQPCRWLEDKTAKYKKNSIYNKYEKSISKYIKDLEIIDAEEAENIFDAIFNFDLGIFICDKNGGYDYNKLSSNNIVSKVFEIMDDNIDNHIEFNEPKNAIVVPLIVGGKGDGYDLRNNVIDLYLQKFNYNMVIYDEYGKRLDNGLTFYENRKKSAWGIVKIRTEQYNIKFNTIYECINFFNYTRTYLFRYIFNQVTTDIRVQPKFLPYMKDYTKTWTDEKLYSHFNITKEEQDYIEKYIDKFEFDIWNIINEKDKRKKI